MTLSHPSLEVLAPFVNRERERGTLKGLFDKTVAGHGCTVLLAGEAGIGKTRLVGEFSQEARSAGSMFVEGSSFEQEGSIPYSPWVEIIQQLLKKIPAATFRKTPEWVISEIGVIVPQILSQARGLGLKAWLKGPRSTSTLLPAADQDRIRLFQAISELLSLVEDKGLVVFLDDLVWADPLSLQMFHYLARRTGERRMMLIGAYRDLELRDDHPLAVMVRDLSRHHKSHDLAIGRFTNEHVSSLLAKQLGAPVSKELSQLICSRTSGNPFFVEEVVRSLVEQGLLAKSGGSWTVGGIKQVEIPSSVRTIIKQRTSRLSEECNQLLSIASLIGMEFDFDILRLASGFSEEESMALLESAVKLRLVHEKRAGSKVVYCFADEQVLDYFAEQLSLLRARKYHATIGRAMEEAYGSRIEDRLGELAYHFVEGASVEKAREYSIKAGDRSAELYAHSDATKHWTNALELMPEDDHEGRLALMTKLAWSAFSQSRTRDALRFCETAIEVAQGLREKTKMAELYELQGAIHFLLGGSKEKALESYRKGREAFEGEAGTRQEAALIQGTARIYALTGEQDRAVEELEKAIELSSRLGAYDALSQCYVTLGLTFPISRKAENFSYQEKALKLGEEHGASEAVIRARNNLGAMYMEVKADYEKAEENMLQALEVAEKFGSVHYLNVTKGGLAWGIYLPSGKWEKAEKIANELVQFIRDVPDITGRYTVEPYNTFASILTARGEFQKAEEFSDQAVSMASKAGWSESLANSYRVRGALYLARGMLENAEGDLLASRKFAKQVPFDASDMIDVLFMLVLVGLKQGRLEKAISFWQELHEVVLALDENWGLAYDKWAEGLIAEARGDGSSSLSLIEESVDRWRRVERPYELARAYRDLARVQEKTGRKAEAENSLNAAGKLFTQLGIPATLIGKGA